MKSILHCTLIVGFLFVQGCNSSATDSGTSPGNDKGQVSIALVDVPVDISQIVATMTRSSYGAMVRSLSISNSDRVALGLFSAVPTGTWHLVVTAFDTSGAVRYTGESDVNVSRDHVTNILTSDVHISWAVPCAPPSGLVSWWPGDGNSTDVFGHNNGVLLGGATYHTGKVGQGFSFDGINDYFVVPADSTLGARSFTFELWVSPTGPFPNDSTTSVPIIEFNDNMNRLTSLGVHLWHSQPARYSGNGPGCLFANLRDIYHGDHFLSTPANAISPDTWNHIGLTYDYSSGVAKLFVNGQEKSRSTLGQFIPRTSIPLYVGLRPPSGAHATGAYRGDVDELSLYSRALTLSEINFIYNAGAAGKCR